MCGRFSTITMAGADGILREIERGIAAEAASWGVETGELDTADARPGTLATAILPTGGTLSLAQLTWGLPVPWDASKLLFNTRIEKAAGESGMWPPIAAQFRCLVPATRFWERSREGKPVAFVGEGAFSQVSSQASPNPSPQANLQAALASDLQTSSRALSCAPSHPSPRTSLIMMAGIHFEGRMSVVTTAPAPEVARFHDRMPLCLTPLQAALWLSPAWRDTPLAGTVPHIIAERPSTPVQLSLF